MTPEQYALFARIEEEHWWFVARREIMRTLLAHALPPNPAKIVVDIGCGTGGNIAALSAQYSCVGIDDSEHAIAHARERYSGVEFIRTSDPVEVGAQLGRADAMLCMDVVEHVEQDAAFLEMLVRATHPGAQLLFTVPAGMELWGEHDVTNGHFRRYTIETFERLWADLPVRVRLLSTFNSRLYPLVLCARAVGRIRGRAYGAANTDFAMPTRPMNALLRRAFEGEKGALRAAVDGARRPFGRGVSVVALLERTAS